MSQAEADATEAAGAAATTRILVAVDGSQTSRTCLDWALQLFPKQGLLVIILCVYPLEGMPGAWTTLQKAAGFGRAPQGATGELVAKDIAAQAVALGEQAGVRCSSRVLCGDARDVICQVAESLKVDAVLVGSRGLTALQRALLGSVSTYVVNQCTRPVLVVK